MSFLNFFKAALHCDFEKPISIKVFTNTASAITLPRLTYIYTWAPGPLILLLGKKEWMPPDKELYC
jgi:hypothetical protein